MPNQAVAKLLVLILLVKRSIAPPSLLIHHYPIKNLFILYRMNRRTSLTLHNRLLLAVSCTGVRNLYRRRDWHRRRHRLSGRMAVALVLSGKRIICRITIAAVVLMIRRILPISHLVSRSLDAQDTDLPS
jgi:hypothetical protein